MDIKDFKVGQTVYIVYKDQVYTKTVSYIGRKYPKLSGEYNTKFTEDEKLPEGLVETPYYMHGKLLFPSEQAVSDYREKQQLIKWMLHACTYTNAKSYSLEQLRNVKKILGD